MKDEEALIGAQQICKFMGWKISRLYHKADHMKKAGVLFTDTFGQIPNRHKTYITWPTLLIRYMQELQKKDEKW